MALVDMKLTPKEVKEEKAEYSGSPQVPPYPWGLCLRLEKEELDKLKLPSLPQVGEEFHISAVGIVTSVSSALRDQKDEEKTVSIQITMLDMSDEGPDDGDSVASENKENAKRGPVKTVMSKY